MNKDFKKYAIEEQKKEIFNLEVKLTLKKEFLETLINTRSRDL